MILRFLRRSSLNGESWSIAIRSSSCSLQRQRKKDRPLLSKSPRRAEPCSCRPCSSTQRKTAGRRARRFSGGDREEGKCVGRSGQRQVRRSEASSRGEMNGLANGLAYMHADAAWGRTGLTSCEVGIGIATGRCLRLRGRKRQRQRQRRQKQGRGRRSYPLTASRPCRSLGLVVVAYYQVQHLQIKSSCVVFLVYKKKILMFVC